MPAKYILRFDDIHPRMNWSVWYKLEKILIEWDIKPILAVIPSNKDEKIIWDSSISEKEFWEKMLYYNSLGWTIAMHGYEHRYVSKECGDFVKINNYSEFAGLPEDVQKEKILKGKEVFIKNGLDPKVFVAPAHTFDRKTVKILAECGFEIISDGFFFYPRRRLYLIWVPQQLWRFKKLPFGLYTICFHPNYWSEKDLDNFERNIRLFKDNIVSLKEGLDIYPPKDFDFFDKAIEYVLNMVYRSKMKAKKVLKLS